MTDIEKVINSCKWRHTGFDVVICKCESIPCVTAIDEGKCETLKEYVNGESFSEVAR